MEQRNRIRLVAGASTGMQGKAQLDDVLFYCGLVIWLVPQLVNWYTFFATVVTNDIVTASRWISVAMLAASEAIALRHGVRWSWRSALALGLCTVAGICCWRMGNMAMLFMLPVLFCARNRDHLTIFKIMAVTYLATIFVCVVCSQLGLIQNVTTETSWRHRHYVGFRYPLYPATMLLLAACLYAGIKKKDVDYWALAALLLGGAFAFALTVSRLSFGVLAIALVAAAILKAAKAHKPSPRWLAGIFSSCFLICAIASIALTLAYGTVGGPLLRELNALLGRRLALGYKAIVTYGLAPFGQYIPVVSNTLTASGQKPSGTYNFIDSIYIQCLVRQGIAFLGVYVIGMTAATWRAFRSGDPFIGAMLVLIAVHGMIDNQTIYLWMNPFMFYAVGLLSEPTPTTIQGDRPLIPPSGNDNR